MDLCHLPPDGMTDRLAALLADPTSVPVEEIPTALGALEAIKAVLCARLTQPTRPDHRDQDQLLDVEETAARLKTSPDWLRRHGGALPFTVHLSPGQVRYSAKRLDQWIAHRAGKGPC